MSHLAEQLARCDREIAAMRAQTEKPAYLVTLGIEDWECEKRLLQGFWPNSTLAADQCEVRGSEHAARVAGNREAGGLHVS